MPRLPALRIKALARLDAQLRYEPPAAARLKLERAEALAEELAAPDAAETLPESYVLFRLTGLRLDDDTPGAPPALLVREALVGDLSALIDRLSSAAKLTDADLRPRPTSKDRWLELDELLLRWSISRKTLERLRRRGLLARRVAAIKGSKPAERLVFRLSHVERFEKAHAAALVRAGAFTRLDDTTRAAILLGARALLAEKPVSLTACAKALAAKHKRSVQSIRAALTSPGPAGETPLFTTRPRLDARDRSRLEKSRVKNVPLAAAARQLKRSRATGYRQINLERVARLRTLDLSGPTSPLLDRPDAAEVLLAPPIARTGLEHRWSFPLGYALLLPPDSPGPDARDELALATAIAFLRRRAAARIVALDRHAPAAGALDDIHTDLLHASRLKSRLAMLSMPLLARTTESAARPARELSPAARDNLAATALSALLEAIDRFDPFKGGRLAASASVAISRAIARLVRDHPDLLAAPAAAPRAARRAPDPAAAPDDFTRRVDPWQADLDLAPALLDRLHVLDDQRREIVGLRFALLGPPPQSPRVIATELHLRPTRVAQLLRTALATLHAAPSAPRSS